MSQTAVLQHSTVNENRACTVEIGSYTPDEKIINDKVTNMEKIKQHEGLPT